jgi:hypothetical protein
MKADDLPQTLAECHALIREYRAMDEEPFRQTGAIVGNRLGVAAQQGALLLMLANSRRPLSSSQIELDLPSRTGIEGRRSITIVRVLVASLRRTLGAEAVLSNGRGANKELGYWLSPEWKQRVKAAAG